MTNYLISGMVGIMLFFTVIVAPTVFKVLPVEWSSKYVRNFFPKYYAALGIVSTACIFIAQDIKTQYLLTVCAVLFGFLLLYLTNKINEAKDSGRTKQFHWLHGASVVINLLQLGIFIYILVVS